MNNKRITLHQARMLARLNVEIELGDVLTVDDYERNGILINFQLRLEKNVELDVYVIVNSNGIVTLPLKEEVGRAIKRYEGKIKQKISKQSYP